MSLITESWPFELSHTSQFVFYDNFLSKQQCTKFIKQNNQKNKKGKATVGDNKLNKKIRDCYTSWIGIDDKSLWFYNELVAKTIQANADYFKFDLWGLTEALQFTHYIAPNNYYNSHLDMGFNKRIRKLSAVVMLSDPKDFNGGELCLYTGKNSETGKDYVVIEPKQGRVVFFPSYLLHKVNPITKGERFSLVAWFTGPNFK